MIDATEYALPSVDEDIGFYKIAKYNYFPGWHQQASAFELLINKDAWSKLSPAQIKLASLWNTSAPIQGESLCILLIGWLNRVPVPSRSKSSTRENWSLLPRSSMRFRRQGRCRLVFPWILDG